MPRVTLNLSEAQSRKPIPDAVYPLTIKEFSKVQQGPKARYITVTTEISEGEHVGRKFYDNLPVEGQGAGIFCDFLSKVTGQEINVDDLEELDVDTDDLVGSPIGAVVKAREYPEGSGEFRSEVRNWVKAK